MTSYIVHLTPALANNYHIASKNLGDLIIFESVQKELVSIFGDREIITISTHDYPEKKHIRLIQQAEHTFIGGSNLLSSDIRKYNQWKYSKSSWNFLFPQIKNINLIGVGWWQYQDAPTQWTSHFYRSVFSHKHILSVRDAYTLKQLRNCGIENIINTSCPTTWTLDGLKTNKTSFVDSCLFALTDYLPDTSNDNELIEQLSQHYKKLYCFPQGTDDHEYLQQLPAYQKNREAIVILDRDIESLRTFIKSNSDSLDYIGTRLHLGIFCLQHRIPSLIVSIDNRAAEIGADIQLPVVERGNNAAIKAWIENQTPVQHIRVNTNHIQKWKEQFASL